MNSKNEGIKRSLVRAMAIGVLLSMLFVYSVHPLGTWNLENYQPDSQTTSTLLLHNTCAFFNDMHTLRPNTEISSLAEGITGTKLSGSFMNFTDGHIVAMIVISVILGGLIFYSRRWIKNHGRPRPGK